MAFFFPATGDVTDLLPDVLDALRVLLFAIVWLLVNRLAKLAMCILLHCFNRNENSVYEDISEDRKMVSLT